MSICKLICSFARLYDRCLGSDIVAAAVAVSCVLLHDGALCSSANLSLEIDGGEISSRGLLRVKCHFNVSVASSHSIRAIEICKCTRSLLAIA